MLFNSHQSPLVAIVFALFSKKRTSFSDFAVTFRNFATSFSNRYIP